MEAIDRSLYPFASNYLSTGKYNLHYVDEGEGECLICVHGNPTWSFYYRNVIKHFSKTQRVIALDHMGCGLSDKPKDYPYTLEQRIADLDLLVQHLGLKKYSLMVHDWGGAIGFGHAVNHQEQINKVIILNTAAFTMKRIPFTINLCKLKYFGPFIVKYLNAFAYPATFMTTKKKLSRDIKKAYLLPYNTVDNRRAVSEFVQDIPMSSEHRSYAILKDIENKLSQLQCPKLLLWGGEDFCFNDEFFVKWTEIYPEAKYKYFKDTGHYILEDAGEKVIQMTQEFLDA